MTNIDQAKQAVRDRVWRLLEREGAAEEGSYGKIPGFRGAEATAEHLAELDVWKQAQTIKANPDWAQLPVRVQALKDGKLLYMAVPRMASLQPFFLLDPASLDLPPEQAAEKKGAAQVAHRVGVEDMQPIDIVVCGSVAVNRSGARIGKGAGYSDLEVALLIEAGLVTDETVIVAPVHQLQVVDEEIPETEHDFSVDLIVTPDEVIQCSTRRRPRAVIWEDLTAEKAAAIPVLAARQLRLRPPSSPPLIASKMSASDQYPGLEPQLEYQDLCRSVKLSYNGKMTPILSISRNILEFRILDPVFDGDCTITLRYRIVDGQGVEVARFDEEIALPGDAASDYDRNLFDRVLRLLSMAGSLSYYKSCVPPTIAVPNGLTRRERFFLTSVLLNGLAEFAYRNNMPESLRPEIKAPVLADDEPIAQAEGNPDRVLVAVGGGKDSIVTIESVRRLPIEVSLFSVNEYAPIRATANHAGLDLHVAKRHLDPRIFELNAQGALNGHIPVTAINSLIACLTAIRSGYDGVVFSNEASSSFGNLTWEGVDVNHQWSKGIEFEGLIREHIAGPLAYFSFLRPLTELAIMRRFADLTDYHQIFTSCNRAFHLDPSKRRLWCGNCPKCRFVFLCLAPFISRDRLLQIFGGRDLFADDSQLEGFLELLNVGDRIKPFECVGEPKECRVALIFLSRHEDWHDHAFLGQREVRAALTDEITISSLFEFQNQHFLPEMFERAARELL